MRVSCNGCRVLRKGCSDDCSIRPCLHWIKNPDSQGNATVFLAKFYGRAGLQNLINAGPEHLRPAIFRSLLYEACGRIVNPIYGAVGLLWSNNWQLCQSAVEAVLEGAPVIQISSAEAASIPMLPLKAFDIRHVQRDSQDDLHKVDKTTRTRFKRSGTTVISAAAAVTSPITHPGKLKTETTDPDQRWRQVYEESTHLPPSHGSSATTSWGGGGGWSARASPASGATAVDWRNESMFSVETVEEPRSTVVIKAERSVRKDDKEEEDKVELKLTLGLEPTCSSRSNTITISPSSICSFSEAAIHKRLRLTPPP